MTDLRVGLVLPLFSGSAQKVMAFAARADALGYDGVFAFDHFFPPGAAPDRPSLEAFTTIAAVAAAFPGLHVGTLVTRAQLRPAGLIAKMAASIDEIAAGRMILGIGTGDPIDRPEHQAFGIRSLTKQGRRAHLTETVRALKSLFAGEPWDGGELVTRMEGPLLPRPERPGGPPIWVGGQSDEVVRIAGRVADGWNGWGLAPPQFEEKAAVLAESSSEAGRRATPTWAGITLVGADDHEADELLERRRTKGLPEAGVWVGGSEAFAAHLRALGQAGATWAVVVPAGPADRVELIAERVLPAVRGRAREGSRAN